MITTNAATIHPTFDRAVAAVALAPELAAANPLPLDSRFTEPLLQAITAAQGSAPLLSPAMGGSLPNYAFTKTLGIPTFGVPYANADEANHAPNENMEVARFFMGIKTGAAMLSYLGRFTL